eukprot:4154449-Lingulodinium_polyedra.AAC.1
MNAWLGNTTCPATGATRGQRSWYSPTDMNMANGARGKKLTHRNTACKKASTRTHAKLRRQHAFFQRCV